MRQLYHYFFLFSTKFANSIQKVIFLSTYNSQNPTPHDAHLLIISCTSVAKFEKILILY